MRKKFIIIFLFIILLLIVFCIANHISPIDFVYRVTFSIISKNDKVDTTLLYLGNYIMALFIALMINSILVFIDSRIKKAKLRELEKRYNIKFDVHSFEAVYTHTSKEFNRN